MRDDIYEKLGWVLDTLPHGGFRGTRAAQPPKTRGRLP
jgi:hypothetical protein